jgi:hypothetical protein
VGAVTPKEKSHKGHDFRKTVIQNKIIIFIFSTNLSEIFLIIGSNERDIIINILWSSY